MTEAQVNFITEIAKYVIKYAPMYGIKVHSPVIAQAILESGWATTNKAKYHNYFGLKYRHNRVTCNNGTFIDDSQEQLKSGQYVDIRDQWYSFSDMAHGVEGYFQFINTPNYSNLKGVTDPKTYLELIRSDGYATSLNYVSNLMRVINTYNLTQYDTGEVDTKLRINVHAGHNPDGKIGCGAIGYIKESTEARAVKNEVIKLLQSLGHTVYDCTEDNGKSGSDVLTQIVKKCNAHEVDLDVSIHFNAGSSDSDDLTTGTEVLLYSSKSGAKSYAENTLKAITSLGFRNRGIKYRTDLYVLRKTKAPAMLIECCFIDDKDDIRKYDYKTMAQAIVKGITGQTVNVSDPEVVYRVQVGAFNSKINAETLLNQLKVKGFEGVIVSSG